ncbi:hypothetical protein PPACK8108_LOCUS1106 [Phakopsora pachyrhizi]|uniref:BHLH domain-containing protein n=1 Tax=Phakopsora pachyrhizi TaxID=170000 RepID=A0AAV0AIT4_PHAPC|nr:hypothetical protein PPACK8108_LOCUS1106 [Phakopsora pachyrhizi]
MIAPSSASMLKSPQTDSSLGSSNKSEEQTAQFNQGGHTISGSEFVISPTTVIQSSILRTSQSANIQESLCQKDAASFSSDTRIKGNQSLQKNSNPFPNLGNNYSTNQSVGSFQIAAGLHGNHRPLIDTTSGQSILGMSTQSSPTGVDFRRLSAGDQNRRCSSDTNSPMAPPITGQLPSEWTQNLSGGYPTPSLNLYGQVPNQPKLYYPPQKVASPPVNPISSEDNAAYKANRNSVSDALRNSGQSPFSLSAHGDNSAGIAGWNSDGLSVHRSMHSRPQNQCTSAANLSTSLFVDDKVQNIYGQSYAMSSLPAEDRLQQAANQISSNPHKPGCHSKGDNSVLTSSFSQSMPAYLEKIPENLVVLGEAGSAILNSNKSHEQEESGHNAVEKRYRNNINSHIASLADLVPALQHLRSLPSAATSRRHSSQFIVSTSAIGKIPTGLVDGVKAATKLSKGNILSKSVDYVRHLIRTRVELKEDIEDLKAMIKARVNRGDMLILEWEELVNSKIPERERQRVLEQSQGEDDGDEEEELNEPGGKKAGQNSSGNFKKRKVNEMKSAEGKPKSAAAAAKFNRRNQTHQLSNAQYRQKTSFSGTGPLVLRPESALPSSTITTAFDSSTLSKEETNKIMPRGLVDELEILRQPPSNYHHQYLSAQSNNEEFSHLQHSGYSSDFMGNPFSPSQPVKARAENKSQLTSRPLLAVFMGVSFAVGSGYNYHQARQKQGAREPAHWESHKPSAIISNDAQIGQSPACYLEFSRVRVTQPPGVGQVSAIQAGLNAMSIASIIWTVIIIFKPEFLLNLIGPTQMKRSNVLMKKNQIVDDESDDESDKEDVDFCSEGCAEISRREKQSDKTQAIPEISNAQLTNRIQTDQSIAAQGKSYRMKEIRRICTWMRIAEVETIWDCSQVLFLRRIRTAIKLSNLAHLIDWDERVTREELDHGRILAALALLLGTTFGEYNKLSLKIWDQARVTYRNENFRAGKGIQSRRSELPSPSYQPTKVLCAKEAWVAEALSVDHAEACKFLAKKRVVDSLIPRNWGPDSDWSPLRQIVETRAELELVTIWSRIFVSAINKTCPVEESLKDPSWIGNNEFWFDGGLSELPTRIEEAGDFYALQINQGRRMVEESIEKICRLGLHSESDVAKIAKVTRGMWAIAFGKRNVGVEVAEEMKVDQNGWRSGCVEPFVELVLGIRSKVQSLEESKVSTLDMLATMTINWILIRREHILLNVVKSCEEKAEKKMFLEQGSRRERLKEMCKQLRWLIEMMRRESEQDRELNAKSTKQADEAVKAGESREKDLEMAIEECKRSISIVERTNISKIESINMDFTFRNQWDAA